MASLSDILSTIQQGVISVNNLVTQTKGSLLNIQSQLSAVSSGVKSFNGRVGVVTPAQGDYPATLIPGSTGVNAITGNIGEYVTSVVSSGSAVSAGSGVATNITSVSLGAGNWDVWGTGGFLPAGAMTVAVAAVSTASGAFPADSLTGTSVLQATLTSGARQVLPVSTVKLTFTASASVFLVGQMTSSGVLYGRLDARRVA